MNSDLKIYYNDSLLLVTSDRAQMNKNFTAIFEGEKEVNKFLNDARILFDGKTNGQILIITNTPRKVLEKLYEQTQLVIAGGGIVFNERNELLMIFRRGKWDLPKGKIETNEEIITGAAREVEEETGVLIETVSEKPVHTYHAYTLKGKKSVKETSWYEMKAKPNQLQLTPQTEEDIEDVRWVKLKDLKKYKSGCYPLIWDLINQYAY